MNKYFVTFEQALALKELGFDQPCLASWFKEERLSPNPTFILNSNNQFKNSNHPGGNPTAPLYSQAFEWFREKGYKFHIYEDRWNDWCSVYINVTSITEYVEVAVEPTHQQAESACLDELIKIVKQC